MGTGNFFITGASSELGKLLTAYFAYNGGRIFLTSYTDEGSGYLEHYCRQNDNCYNYPEAVAGKEAWKEAVTAAQYILKRVDVVVNIPEAFETNEARFTDHDLNDMVGSSFRNTLYLMTEIIPFMTGKNSSLVINITKEIKFKVFTSNEAQLPESKSLSDKLILNKIKDIGAKNIALLTIPCAEINCTDPVSGDDDRVFAITGPVTNVQWSAVLRKITRNIPSSQFYNPGVKIDDGANASGIELFIKQFLKKWKQN